MIQSLKFNYSSKSSLSLFRYWTRQFRTQNSMKSLSNSIYLYSQSKSAKPAQLDELMTYQIYLRKHNQSLRKPHEKLKTEEERIFTKYIEASRQPQLISFLVNNANLRLCHINTALMMDKYLTSRYSNLTNQQKRDSAFALISFRQPRLFSKFRAERQSELANSKIENIDIQDLMVYLYGQLINLKNINFIKNIKTSLPKIHIVEGVYQCLSYPSYKGKYHIEKDLLLQYLKLVMNPSLNKIETHKNSEKKRSILQTDIQAFLTVLKYDIDREIAVNSFAVDYLVQRKDTPQKIALQINGSYHYTLNNKIKGRQILRNMIVNQCLPLRIVHHQDYLLSKGYRNKQAHLEEVIQSEVVNWECKNKGTNSQWVVTETQEYE